MRSGQGESETPSLESSMVFSLGYVPNDRSVCGCSIGGRDNSHNFCLDSMDCPIAAHKGNKHSEYFQSPAVYLRRTSVMKNYTRVIAIHPGTHVLLLTDKEEDDDSGEEYEALLESGILEEYDAKLLEAGSKTAGRVFKRFVGEAFNFMERGKVDDQDESGVLNEDGFHLTSQLLRSDFGKQLKFEAGGEDTGRRDSIEDSEDSVSRSQQNDDEDDDKVRTQTIEERVDSLEKLVQELGKVVVHHYDQLENTVIEGIRIRACVRLSVFSCGTYTLICDFERI